MSVPFLLFGERSHWFAGDEASSHVSSDDNEVSLGVWRKRAEGIFTTVFQYECDGITKISKTLFPSTTLSIGTGDLSTIRDVP